MPKCNPDCIYCRVEPTMLDDDSALVLQNMLDRFLLEYYSSKGWNNEPQT